MGRNILLGQNLRDSLGTKSKTYTDMENTINKELQRLENFSIINGAQTTSALGAYLKKAIINNDQEAIDYKIRSKCLYFFFLPVFVFPNVFHI